MNSQTLNWIEHQKAELVEAAEGFVTAAGIADPRPETKDKKPAPPRPGGKDNKPKAKISGSQLRNLLSVAQSERSLAVLLNFLHYQMGRAKGWPDLPSGEALYGLLREAVKKRIDEAVEEKAFGADFRRPDRFLLESRLSALLLGYIIREYTYQCKIAGTDS